jgi:hypothetical protein
MIKRKRKNWVRIPIGSSLMMLAIAACSTQAPEPQNEMAGNVTVAGNSAEPGTIGNGPAEGSPAPLDSRAPAGTPGTPGGLPDDRTPLEEPNGPIDPASAEAAGQAVQRYGGLLEQRKFAQARKMWGQDGQASGLSESQFAAAYGKYATIHSEVGKPTGMEGAAGSSYITVPFRLYGTLKSGGSFNLVGPLTLRRVNDVPGATEAQRRWHIEKSGLKPRP